MPILTWSWHLLLGLVPFSLPSKVLYQLSITPIRVTCPTNLFLLDLVTLGLQNSVQIVSDVIADMDCNQSPRYA